MAIEDDLVGALSWRSIGPPRGGRVVAVAGDPVEPGVFYFGSCGGGVWKTTDAGNTWVNLSDGYLSSGSIGAIAVASSDPSVIYVGTGEACPRNDVIAGDGLYCSTDGGRSFAHRGLEQTRHIARVRVSPRDPNLVYVAALGDVWGPSEHRGIYRSRDGGRHFDLVLAGSAHTGAADLYMDPGNPLVLYATLWQMQRRPWDFSSGGETSGLYCSTDGGDSWTELTHRPGLPTGLLGRMGVASAPRRPERVFVLIEAAGGAGGLYRSDNAGASFQAVSTERGLLGRPWYYSHIVPDPGDPDTLYAMNYDFWRSIDGGVTWAEIATPHGDNHDLWIDPKDSTRMIEANDGGACVSLNGARTFSSIYNQPTGAFYKMAIDHHFPYRVYGTQQDNSAMRVPSRSRGGAITFGDCEEVGHAESGDIVLDPRDENIVYAGAVGSSGGGGAPLLRHDHRSGETSLVTIWPEWNSAMDPARFTHRFAWTFPLLVSRHDPAVLYAGGECLFRTTDAGQSWKAVSPDLTRNDAEKLAVSGGPITKDTSGAEVYCTISALAESPADARVLYVGTDDGLLHRSDDGGETWTRLTVEGLPEWSWVTGIELCEDDPDTLFLTATRYRLADRAPYVFRSTDRGASFVGITDGLGEGDFARVIRVDRVHRGVVYLGTERGPYVSLDSGDHWRPLRLNLPAVPIYDLALKDGDLVAATHGRGFFILDHAGLLPDLVEAGSSDGGPSLVVAPRAYRYRTGEAGAPSAERTQYRGTATALVERDHRGRLAATIAGGGTNPPDGVVIYYRLPEGIELDRVRLTVRSDDGSPVRAFSFTEEVVPRGSSPRAEPKDKPAGPLSDRSATIERGARLQRAIWNLSAAGAYLANPALRAMAEDERDGPLVPPGEYVIELDLDGTITTAICEVLPDPNLGTSAEELASQFSFAMRVRDAEVAINTAIATVKQLSDSLSSWQKRGDLPETAQSSVADGLDRLREVELVLTQPGWSSKYDDMELPAGLDAKLLTLSQAVSAGGQAPTAQAREVGDLLFSETEAALDRLHEVIAGPIAAANAAIAAAGVDAIPLVTLATATASSGGGQ